MLPSRNDTDFIVLDHLDAGTGKGLSGSFVPKAGTLVHGGTERHKTRSGIRSRGFDCCLVGGQREALYAP